MPPAPLSHRLATLAQSPLTTPSTGARRTAVVVLAALMLATRQYHFGVLSDASWAVFFLGGFYVGTFSLFAAFMAGAVAIDYVATQHLGVSSYCLSPAYGFLIPSYASLWVGGLWAARHWHAERPLHSAAGLALSLWIAVTVCFVISNGSFYWLGGRVAPTLSGWSANFRDWYGAFLVIPAVYVTLAGAVQLLGSRWVRRTAPALGRTQAR